MTAKQPYNIATMLLQMKLILHLIELSPPCGPHTVIFSHCVCVHVVETIVVAMVYVL